MVAAGEHRAARRRAACQQIDPGHRVPVVVVGGRQACHEVVEIPRAFRVDGHQRGLHRLELERGRQDHAGQAHAAGGRVEQRRASSDGTDLAVSGEEFQRQDVTGERARHVVVLAVDVGPDGAADRHIAGAGRHRNEPAEREQHLHQPVQGDTRVAGHGAAVGVDRVDAVQAGHVEHRAPGVLRRVPVRPPQAPRDASASPAAPDGGRRLLVRPGADQAGCGGGGAAPSRDGDGVGRHVGDRSARI